MAFLSSMDIVASGLSAQQMRMDVISENVTNMNTTRTEAGGAYRRKVVVLESVDGRDTFRMAMDRACHHECRAVSNRAYSNEAGVRLTAIVEDPSEMPLVYDPNHPDANAAGYVEMPNVTLVKEITDLMAASQAYNANITAFNTMKQVIAKGMEIGR